MSRKIRKAASFSSTSTVSRESPHPPLHGMKKKDPRIKSRKSKCPYYLTFITSCPSIASHSASMSHSTTTIIIYIPNNNYNNKMMITPASTYADGDMKSRAEPFALLHDKRTTLGQKFLNYWWVAPCHWLYWTYCQYLLLGVYMRFMYVLVCCLGTMTTWTLTTRQGSPK